MNNMEITIAFKMGKYMVSFTENGHRITMDFENFDDAIAFAIKNN